MYQSSRKSEKNLFISAFLSAFIFASVLFFIDIPSVYKALLLFVIMGMAFVMLYIYLFTGDQVNVQKAKDRVSTAVIGLLHSTNGISSLLTYNSLIRINLDNKSKAEGLLDQEKLIIDEYSEKVQSIVSDLSSSFRTDKTELDLNALVRQSGEYIRLKRIRDKKIPILIKTIDDKLPALVSPSLLKTALENIIDNSYDELLEVDRSDSRIRVTVEQRDNSAVICIDDNGRGLKGEKGDVPSSQIKPGRTTKRNGNGLGLYVSIQSIEECGGTFNMFSSQDGLKTVLTFPI